MGNDRQGAGPLLRHPHQGLWNRRLVDAVKRRLRSPGLQQRAIAWIVRLDTLQLFLRALRRRWSLLGAAALFSRARVPAGTRVVYLDLGTHKKAAELARAARTLLPAVCDTFEAHGFEASRESFEQASQALAGVPGVRVHHLALTREVPPGGHLRLYKDAKGGIGDSLYRVGDAHEEVPAARLSDWLRESGVRPEQAVLLLRMNVEGAEYDVLQDLVDAGVAGQVDGWYGMWDDVGKIDPRRDEEFGAFLARHGIRPLTFNGRDLRWPLRVKCVAYDLRTSALAGARRVRGGP